MFLSVVICSYNPKPSIIARVLDSLQQQTLDRTCWELILVDNNSTEPLSKSINLSWHPHGKIIREPRAGLFHARVCGVENAQAPLIVFADDDNVLGKDYLLKSYTFHQSHPEVGCFGGKSLPVFETPPPGWFAESGINLGCQNYGDHLHISNYAAVNFHVAEYPQKAPIGTGMVILKKAFLLYLEEVLQNPDRAKLGRRGKSLSSGEDNDIILTIVKKGFEIAYLPDLVVQHLIPANRYSKDYLKRMAFESNRTWMKVLHYHSINPRKKINKLTYLPRKLKSYLNHRAWRSPLSEIQWMASCGTFKGLSEL
ncbi:MAG: glycosyltransferase family 2 protein [Chitinophagaceae bacterium]|nr:MAG: glycosyltransferase family 2 protein [Chitinophagaceae bacterium]